MLYKIVALNKDNKFTVGWDQIFIRDSKSFFFFFGGEAILSFIRLLDLLKFGLKIAI